MKMKWILSLVPLLLVSVIPSRAQCGIYTYHDMWMDSNGSIVGDNYTQASCEEPTAYAEVHVRMPSGQQVAESASGVTSAEAIAQYTLSDEYGDGDFWGYNSAFNNCTQTESFFSFESPIHANAGVEWIWWDEPVFIPITGKCMFNLNEFGITYDDVKPAIMERDLTDHEFHLALPKISFYIYRRQ